jgi:bla regulator protein blaR1
LWQSTVFAVVVGLLTLAFRKNRAQVRYFLWFSASVKFLIPFSLLMSLGHDLLSTLAARKIATKIAAPALSGAIVQIVQPFPDTVTLGPAARHATHWIPIVILGVWACGFAAVALMRFRGWLRVRAALHASTPIDIPAPVPVCSCPGLLEPGVVGFLRPVVLLPDGILETLSQTQVEVVLAHELSHARRRDNLTAAIHMIVEAVFWFYPLVWWIGARLVEERERACDESVLILGSEPREYADAILNVCKHYVKSPVVCVSGIIGSELKRRIVHIMARHIGRRLTPARKWLLGGAAAAAIVMPLALGMTGASKAATHGAEASNGRLPRFETSSIKLDKLRRPLVAGRLLPGMPVSGVDLSGDNFSATTIVTAMIMDAYGQYMRWLNPTQVLEGPAWIRTDFYEINARVSNSIVNGRWKKLSTPQRWNEAMLMLRSLLINRFKLRVRHEKKVLPVFELVLTKNGPKIAEDKTTGRPCRMGGLGPGKGLGMDVKSCDFSWFVKFLSLYPELRSRVLVDKTALHGRYSFKLHWTPEMPPGTPKPARGGQSNHKAAPSEPSGPPLFTALREQLGLSVVSGKAPEDVLFIEHIERPTPN